MEWQKPSTENLWRAIDVYLALAYQGSAPSTVVNSRVEALRGAGSGFFDSPTVERDAPESPGRFSLRLGNRFYPHMKLVIESTPDKTGHMFRADTHDKHIRPAPDSKEYALFCELMENNQKLAEAIESEWDKQGLPTFKQYLRNDLARRGLAR